MNSYKRLVHSPDGEPLGVEAPGYVSWAMVNRSDLVRVPAYKPGREAARRVEYRAPDAACNPYLAFSVMLAAGLEGIENEDPLPPPVEENIYKMTSQERQAHGVEELPRSLREAIQITEESDLVLKALGERVLGSFIQNKKIEWDRYRSQVTDYEIKQYLPML